ncbi:low temperature requirement protein A [Candidatus Gracilibacteria bacterium]|nr:low temperature requirement protein A [Candidatus Gracilibacteria bacterium]
MKKNIASRRRWNFVGFDVYDCYVSTRTRIISFARGTSVLFGIATFVFVFFIIWSPWMNYTWFSSAYDNDGVIFRILTFFKFLDCSCSQQKSPPQGQKIQILRQDLSDL